jgi:hypothetical protein
MNDDRFSDDSDRMAEGFKRLDMMMRGLSGRGPAPSDHVLQGIAERLTKCPRCGSSPRIAPIMCTEDYCVMCDNCEDLAPSCAGSGIEAAITRWEEAVREFDPEALKYRAWLNDNRESILAELINAKREGREARLPEEVIDWAIEDPYIQDRFIEEFEDDSAKQFRNMFNEMMSGNISAEEFTKWHEDNR